MATITHSFVSAIADGADATLVRPSNWNAAHTFTGITEAELGYLSGVTSAIQTQLNAKAASSHTHAESDITNLVSDLSTLTSAVAGKAATAHTHAQSDITTLVSDLLTLTNAVAAKQTSDATLTALAAANWAANAIPIGSGADTLSQVTFAANTFPARASTGNLEAKTLSDFALTILDDADAATVRATIGAGTGNGNGDALVANPLSQFAATTSAQLLATLTNPTGTGLAVFDTLPTFTTGLTTPVATITQGTITADAPGINHTVTWNNAGVTFSGWKLNVTNTASNILSCPFRVQVGGSDIFRTRRDGYVEFTNFQGLGSTFSLYLAGGTLSAIFSAAGIQLGSATVLVGETSNTIHQRNSTLAQTFRLSNTYTSSTNRETLTLDWQSTANLARIMTEKGSGGGTARAMALGTDSIDRILISALGSVALNGGQAALATTATDGFGYMATCAGTPTGVPTAVTGAVPWVFDTTGVKFWVYTGGAWKGVVVA